MDLSNSICLTEMLTPTKRAKYCEGTSDKLMHSETGSSNRRVEVPDIVNMAAMCVLKAQNIAQGKKGNPAGKPAKGSKNSQKK